MRRGLTFAIAAVAMAGIIALFAAADFPLPLASVPSGSTILETVKHDGHLWVIERSGRPMHFVHHPDCPCKARENGQ